MPLCANARSRSSLVAAPRLELGQPRLHLPHQLLARARLLLRDTRTRPPPSAAEWREGRGGARALRPKISGRRVAGLQPDEWRERGPVEGRERRR